MRMELCGMMEVNQVSILDRHSPAALYLITLREYWQLCPVQKREWPRHRWIVQNANARSQMTPYYRLRLSLPLILSALA